MRRLAGWAMVGGLAPASVAAVGQSVSDPFAGIPNLSFLYYQVHGTDGQAINASLRTEGPTGADGRVGAGRTDYHIDYGWVERRSGRTCRVTDTRASFSAAVRLPRLVEEARLAEPVLRDWRRLGAVLRVHEAGHARIAYEHIDEVREAVAGAPCGKERVRAQAVLDRVERLQQDYDRRTPHGEAQGDIVR